MMQSVGYFVGNGTVMKRPFLSLILCLSIARAAAAVEPWATYRGNPQRTGNTDAKPGPAAPNILWAMKSKEHYIAAPVPAGDRLFVSGLGAFNLPGFACLSTTPDAKKRTLWTKSTPYLRLPTVSSPGVYKGRLVFGDGMHQTDGAVLHCLTVDYGLPLWQLPVPGKLVHLEGSPTIADGKVYIGGGAAGILCVDLDRVTLDGKDTDLKTVQDTLAKVWKELQAKYEIEKKTNPMFAVPPSEDLLPRAQPRRLWQQGENVWHVDAPVNIAGDRLLVCSAFLDKEKEGERALYCLGAAKGTVKWKAPLKLNPWGGASVHDNTVVVTGSSIGYDPGALKGAKGQLVAFDLDGGKEKWTKDIPTGGVVSCAAIAGGQVIVTATDGKVRSFDLATGERGWIYDAKVPFFAPVAVAGGVVYAGDLKGVVHAIDLKTGQPRWTLDLGTHTQTQAPGMIYGGPVVHGGRLYVATCNLEGPHARQATVVVCIGDK